MLKVGIVGAGRMGRFHADAFRKQDASVVAVVDADEAAANAFAADYGCLAMSNVERLLDTGGLDAISICTPPVSHADVCVAAVERGIAVLCEKPLAIDSAGCEQVVSAVTAHNGRLMVAFFNRFFEPVALLKRQYSERQSEWGQVRTVEVVFDLGQQPTRPWLWDKAVSGGGALMNNGVHGLDLVELFAGRTKSGIVRFRSSATSGALDSDCFAILASTGGVISTFRTFTNSVERNFLLNVEFEHCRAEVRWYPPSLRLSWPDGRQENIALSSADPMDRIVNGIGAFVRAIQSNDFSDLPVAPDGARAVDLVERFYASGGEYLAL